MKKQILLILVIIFASLTLAGITHAQEPTPTQDNACYEGGLMWREKPADRCNTPWAWFCGWHFARYQQGILKSIPSQCQILLDLIPPVGNTVTLADGTVGKVEPEAPANCLTLVTVFPGTLMCVNGNTVTFDGAAGGMALPGGPDGVVDTTELIVPENGPCPPGSNFYLIVSSYTAEIEDFVVPLTGAGTNDWVCLVTP